MRAISGSFRVPNREVNAMVFMRSSMTIQGNVGFSMNHIAELFGRSTSTVHHYLKQITVIDKRAARPDTRIRGKGIYEAHRGSLKLRLRMYLQGFFDTLTEAMKCEAIPVRLMDALTENTPSGEEEDPS